MATGVALALYPLAVTSEGGWIVGLLGVLAGIGIASGLLLRSPGELVAAAGVLVASYLRTLVIADQPGDEWAPVYAAVLVVFVSAGGVHADLPLAPGPDRGWWLERAASALLLAAGTVAAGSVVLWLAEREPPGGLGWWAAGLVVTLALAGLAFAKTRAE